MASEISVSPDFPDALLDWAGHRRGGVKRLLDYSSGRPSGVVVETQLLNMLRRWVEEVAAGNTVTPSIVLLVGGPGNGKTEAVEVTLEHLDHCLDLSGRLNAEMGRSLTSFNGQPVPRVASADLAVLTAGKVGRRLQIVQDASTVDQAGASRASLILDELESALNTPTTIYLCCVNRGVLDDALIEATESRREGLREILEAIVRASGMAWNAPSCWPLDSQPAIAIWPMDAESLFTPIEAAGRSPALDILSAALDEARWPAFGSCPAGESCPFCASRRLLAHDPHKSALLRVLRWYELASGKRWTFRDLFSLVSFLLAGEPTPPGGRNLGPCAWAASLLAKGEPARRADSLSLSAPYLLVASMYQHAMFGSWPSEAASRLRKDMKELSLDTNETLLGLYHFLRMPRGTSVPSTLRPQLDNLCDLLDPALSDPDGEVSLSNSHQRMARDLDARFSQSVGNGYKALAPYKCLNKLEADVLRRLAVVDELLSDTEVRNRRPLAAGRIQTLLRQFACRLVRRSLGMRDGRVLDAMTLDRYQRLVEGDKQLLVEASNQVALLLNDQDKFVVLLNTTFGESLPPTPRRVVLTTDKQKVKPAAEGASGRPKSTMRFLEVGYSSNPKIIPLTYELFRSVEALRRGMLVSSLPRTVVALLDTTRAKLAGRIVRDEDALDGGEIRIGLRDEVIQRQLGEFIVQHGEVE